MDAAGEGGSETGCVLSLSGSVVGSGGLGCVAGCNEAAAAGVGDSSSSSSSPSKTAHLEAYRLVLLLRLASIVSRSRLSAGGLLA